MATRQGTTTLYNNYDPDQAQCQSSAQELVVFSTLFERSPVGAAVPDGVDAAAARALQAQAWTLVQQARSQSEPLSPESCRERTQRFIAPYAAYVRDTLDRPRVGLWRAWWLWAKHRVLWRWALRE